MTPQISQDTLRFLDPKAPRADLARGYLDAMLARERNRAGDLVVAAIDPASTMRPEAEAMIRTGPGLISRMQRAFAGTKKP